MENWYLRGAQVFHCREQKDKEWMAEKVQKWQGEGIEIRMMGLSELHKPTRAIIYVPGVHTSETLVKRLGGRALH